MNSILYFAFGSNLHAIQMHGRCPKARKIGPATLYGYRLAFCGYSLRWDGGTATAIADQKSKVQGLLYELNPDGLFALDLYEGIPWIYQRRKRVVTSQNGESVNAYVYLLRDREPNKPSKVYYKVIEMAYLELNFDVQMLKDAMEEAKNG